VPETQPPGESRGRRRRPAAWPAHAQPNGSGRGCVRAFSAAGLGASPDGRAAGQALAGGHTPLPHQRLELSGTFWHIRRSRPASAAFMSTSRSCNAMPLLKELYYRNLEGHRALTAGRGLKAGIAATSRSRP